MKKIIFLFLAGMLVAVPAMAGGNLEKVDIEKEVTSKSFSIGCDRNTGCMSYVIDQTNGICFAEMMYKDGVGLTQVDCNKLMKIDKIRNFYDTGKVDK
ncbi:MAG: hypothetical protein HZB81_01585 [Deltaproteobacteria bacterium]|nr:hypothetical protein [Deltaproteobacteria bacterium]